jgi:sulfide:quinone oxidoreductase
MTWPLPLYELALMTAEAAAEHGRAAQLTLVTPEPAPLAIFGPHAGEAVTALLAEREIAVLLDAHVRSVAGGTVVAAPGDVEVHADRVVAVPVLAGPAMPGLPLDAHGFVESDEHGAVRGLDGVFAAGDGTTLPIKQGGVAAQHAGAAAAAIAARAGADVEPRPLHPELRAQLLAGSTSVHLRQAVAGGGGDQASVASGHALWWPPSKVAAPYLAPYLARLGEGIPGPVPEHERAAIHKPGDPAGGLERLGG